MDNKMTVRRSDVNPSRPDALTLAGVDGGQGTRPAQQLRQLACNASGVLHHEERGPDVTPQARCEPLQRLYPAQRCSNDNDGETVHLRTFACNPRTPQKANAWNCTKCPGDT